MLLHPPCWRDGQWFAERAAGECDWPSIWGFFLTVVEPDKLSQNLPEQLYKGNNIWERNGQDDP